MLEKLEVDLLDATGEACLPQNLSDEWLEQLSTSADYMLGEPSDEAEEGAPIIAVILHLLRAKIAGQTEKVMFSHEELYEYTKLYRIELALEEVNRKSDIAYNPATVETILTEREITTWRK
jgi:hypothetical protein